MNYIFLDIDGVIINGGAMIVDPEGCHNRQFDQTCKVPIYLLNELCRLTDAKVVFNTTHNDNWSGVTDITIAMSKAGLNKEYIHSDSKTLYPRCTRPEAITRWLEEQDDSEAKWVIFDDAPLQNAMDHLLGRVKGDERWVDGYDLQIPVVDPYVGLTLNEINGAFIHFGVKPMMVLL